MDEQRFWALIEEAWGTIGGKTKTRTKLAEGNLDEEKAESLVIWLDEVIPALEKLLDALSQDELLGFDRVLEARLYEIDRMDVQEFTDGSNDGFLYARGFIVACGQAYYDAVNADPSRALMDFECEDLCYLSHRLYRRKFGEVPESDISRESCSNAAGWPELGEA
jgi:hypothetical protein